MSSQQITAIAAGDFNGDGNTDLAFAVGKGGQVLVFTDNGDGTFNSTPLSISLGSGTNPAALAVADFNGDGMPDIAVLNQSANSVGILLNKTSNGVGASLAFAPMVSYPTGLSSPTGFAVGDFNGDSTPDIAAVSGSALAILLNQGGGVFPTTAPTPIAIPLPLSFASAGAIATGDFNGDGILDLAIALPFDPDTVEILNGIGNGTFATATPTFWAVGANPAAMVVVDFNGDGKLDIAVADGDPQGNTVALLLNGTAAAETPPPPAMSMAFGASSIPLNGVTTLSFALSNLVANSTALDGVAFTDTFPAGLVVATPNGLTGTCGGAIIATTGSASVSLSGATLPAGSSCTFSVSVTSASAGTFTNTSGAVTSTNAGTGNIATAVLSVIAPPTLSLTFGAASVALNGTNTLSVTVSNPVPNSTALTGVGFTDTFPAGLVVATSNGLIGACGGTLTAAAGSASVILSGATLPAGSSCTFSVNITGVQVGTQSDTASVTSTNGGTGNPATATLIVVAPLTMSLTFGAASIPLNGTTTLSFMIANPAANGTALTGVAFTDTFPAGLVVATPNGLTGACGGGAVTAAAGSASVILSGATLPAGSSCTFSVNVTGTAAGQFTNTTSAVTSTNGGTGNPASAILAVVIPPSISKAFGASSIPVNGVTTLSFTVSNPPSNPAALSGVAFTDTFPSGLVVATPNGLTGACGGGALTAAAGSASVTLSGATLAAATSCTFSVNVTGTTAGTFTNTVNASSSNGGAGNASSATLTVNTVLAPVNILDTETITVNDAPPAFPDALDTEAVHVLDQVFVAPVEAIAAPVASYSTGSLGFGSVPAGQTATQILTVSNAGQGQTQLALGAPLFSSFAFVLSSVSCSNGAASLLANLASGAECVLMISYTAPAGNAATGTITFADNAALSNLTSVAVGSGSYTQTVALNGSGTTTPASPLPPAVISIPLINEMITVQDSPTFPDIADTEPITVNDQVTVLTLQSIAVTPANSILAVGLTKVFTARGTYSDGSTQDLTAAVTWSSSDQAVASMSGNTATGLARGNTTITATLGSISGSTNLLVTFPFIRIAANFASITLNAAGNYDVTVSFTNTGDIVATAVQPRLALLGRALLPVNTQPALADLAPGVTATLHLVFPASAGSPGAQVAFIAIGTAAGTNPNGSPAAALWVATPLRTVVTLP